MRALGDQIGPGAVDRFAASERQPDHHPPAFGGEAGVVEAGQPLGVELEVDASRGVSRGVMRAILCAPDRTARNCPRWLMSNQTRFAAVEMSAGFKGG